MNSQAAQPSSLFDLEETPCEPFSNTSSNFLTPHYNFHGLNSPIYTENTCNQALFEDPCPRSEEMNEEYIIKYDIYGNSIARIHLSSPVPRYSNNNMSYEFGPSAFHITESPSRDLDAFDNECSDIDMEKENVNPMGALTTPYKSRRTPNAATTSLTGRSTSGRSPLQDITPPVGKRKSVMNSSGIEVRNFLS